MLLSISILNSCKADSDNEFGEALLYIPQSTVQSGGLNNNYTVGLKNSNRGDTIVVVGVYRSGLQALQAVTVDLTAALDTLDYAISRSNTDPYFSFFKSSKLLPEAYYAVPSSIGIKDGEREAWVELKINKNNLISAWDPTVEKYILPLKITNPTRYKLNNRLSTVFFVFTKK